MAEKKLKIPRIEPVDMTTLPRKMPKIEIDYTKCTVPMWCKKCLEVCPQMSFKIYCKEMKRGIESDVRAPGVYEALPVRRDKCTMCGKCVEACPEGALTISFEGTVLKGTKKFDTAAEAKKSPYDLWEAPHDYSFELNEDMLKMLSAEFDPPRMAAKFAEAISSKKGTEIDKVAKQLFTEYGKAWMKRTLQLGEEYSDRTYEVMKEMTDKTGELFFPLVPQRFIEIAYLSTQEFTKLKVIENWLNRLVYQVPGCYMYRSITEKSGALVAERMPCQHSCLAALETVVNGLGVDAKITVDATTAKDGYCQFSLTKV